MGPTIQTHDDRSLDIFALGVNAGVLGASTFFFTLAGMSIAQIEANVVAALIAGGLSAGLRATTYLLTALGLDEGGAESITKEE